MKVWDAGTKIEGATLFHTKQSGNTNNGQRFQDGPQANGVIGPALSAAPRSSSI